MQRCPVCQLRYRPFVKLCAICGAPTESAPVLSKRMPGDRFRLDQRRWTTSTGAEFAGFDNDAGREVSIWIADRPAVEHVRTVAFVSEKIDSPFIRKALAWGVKDNTAYVAYESTSHSPAIQAGPAPEFLQRIFKDVVRGLAAAKLIGVTHNALRPEHILVDPSGNAQVSGFGDSAWPDVRSVIVDVPVEELYASPEQLQCVAGDESDRTDVFRLGCCLYELVVGAPLFAVQRQAGVRTSASLTTAVLRPWMPLLGDMLCPDPTKRPALEQVAFRVGCAS